MEYIFRCVCQIAYYEYSGVIIVLIFTHLHKMSFIYRVSQEERT